MTDDDGYKVKVRLRYFLRYIQHNTDDSPLYIFDSNFDTDDISKCLLQDYTIPSYFPEDYFQLMGERRRPPYRWFLMGPERSGTCIHIDPLGTSAWNTVGKLWKTSLITMLTNSHSLVSFSVCRLYDPLSTYVYKVTPFHSESSDELRSVISTTHTTTIYPLALITFC